MKNQLVLVNQKKEKDKMYLFISLPEQKKIKIQSISS